MNDCFEEKENNELYLMKPQSNKSKLYVFPVLEKSKR